MTKLSKIKEFNIWTNDGIGSPEVSRWSPDDEKMVDIGASREFVMRHKKHKYYEGNKKLKEQFEEEIHNKNEYEDENEDEDKQEFWTQKTDLHFRTCPVCKRNGVESYIKGRCPKCGSLPCEPHPELYNKNYSVRKLSDGSIYSRDKGVERNISLTSEQRRYIRKQSSGSTVSQLRNLGRSIKESAKRSKKIKYIKEDAKGWFWG